MSDIAIGVEKLSKLYRIGPRERYKALRDTLTDAMYAPFRAVARAVSGRRSMVRNSPSNNTIWAIKDVSFEVKQGEVVGIIGRNGAGKTTLLKILSRITEPTEGCAEIRGRVGSLLEVGTGFHPELTGRENIYLNGAILGMKKAEIARKFDEIVDFAEIGKFIDTPVKHFSSGMYVRLAFAVAAHLEPEILLVDEVLAVGDAGFQRKCLGKMGEVSRQGRTVLLVSHNMVAVEGLCGKALLLNEGRLCCLGRSNEVIKTYIAETGSHSATAGLQTTARTGNGRAMVVGATLKGKTTGEGRIKMGETAELSLKIYAKELCRSVNLALEVFTITGVKLFNASTYRQNLAVSLDIGVSRWVCSMGPLLLRPGLYRMQIVIGNGEPLDILPDALTFEVIPADVLGSGRMLDGTGGIVYFPFEWRCIDEPASVL